MNTDLLTQKSRNAAQGTHQSADLNDRLVPMNNYYRIEDVIDRLKHEYDWTHSFIRECYFATDHCMCEFVSDSGETKFGDAGGQQNVRLAIACAGNADDTGIEFVFRDVSVFSIKALDELQFQYDYDVHSGHSVQFSSAEGNRDCYINAKSVFAKFLGRTYLGIDLLLGFEFPTSGAFEAEAVENCWRQCSNCSNVWQENPKIEFSRCPDCGEVTRLKT